MSDEQEKKFYTQAELKEFEALIQEKLKVAKEELKGLSRDLREYSAGGADADNFSDYGVDSQGKEELEMLMARQEKFVFELEKAIGRIRQGNYGICRVTGKLISKERLRVVPHTTVSIAAKREQGEQPPRRG
jgi:DnaK suppressor protein